MLKYFTRFIILTGFTFALALPAKAQLGFNFHQLDAGISLNAHRIYGDADKVKTTFSGGLNFNYNATPYLNYVLEAQGGTFAAGDSLTLRSGRQFKNKFWAITGRVQVQAGEFIDYSQSDIADIAKNIYLSTGVGVVINNIGPISRTSAFVPGFYSLGKDNSTEVYIPLRIGYEFKIFNSFNEPTTKIDIAYQHGIILGENVDGYDTGNRKDIWTQFSIGVKFAIGGSTSYRKPVTRY
jgi:hypothetical protein